MTKQRRPLKVARSKLIVAFTLFLTTGPAMAGTYTVLHSFTGGADGGGAISGVTSDKDGNFYGETPVGGDQDCDVQGCGTVYKLDPAGRLTTLVTFNGDNGAAGDSPLTLVGQTLFGSTHGGGTDSIGVLFSVRTDGTDFTLLHQFNGADGSSPTGPLRAGPPGTAYGVTQVGGASAQGVLFAVRRDGSFTLLHAFTGGADGGQPDYILVAPSGTIYGSARVGGAYCRSSRGCGVIYQYVPSTGVLTVLHSFNENDGSSPILGSLAPDGTLYGTTRVGGSSNDGTLFQLTPHGGEYTFATLTNFDLDTTGTSAAYGPILDANGTLTGNLAIGPMPKIKGSGTIYQYINSSLNIAAPFGSPHSNGSTPESQPLARADGSFVGTTEYGGLAPCPYPRLSEPAGCGTIYRYTP